MSDTHARKLVEAMLASAAMEERASYLGRGRHLAHLSDSAIKGLWALSFKAWLIDRETQTKLIALDDASAELGLRNIPPPAEMVSSEMEKVRAEIKSAGPNNPGVLDAIRQFRESLNNPKN